MLPEQDTHSTLAALYARQRSAYEADPYPSAAQRRDRLSRLIKSLRQHQAALCAAMNQDFGGRSRDESLLADVLGSVLAARHARRHLRRWMKPRRRATELLFLGNRARVQFQPKGVVGIIAPWNFPVYLAIGPLITALAAGNRTLIKGSEYTPKTNAALQAMLDEAFGIGEVAVVSGGVEVARAFTALPLDHLVFTGSPVVAPEVMAAAAQHLTPVTLELGGKSPVLVAPGCALAPVARSVVHGKLFNAGQICVSPDYALVPEADVERFASAVIAAAEAHSEASDTSDDTAIITDRHASRIEALIADAEVHGAHVRRVPLGNAGRRKPLAVITRVSAEMRIAREELFGPILPIIGYASVDDAIRYITARPRPLALYPFGFSSSALPDLLRRTHSGGVTVNDWGWHVFNHDLPFGGIGQSGMGSYHGAEGFRELSHAKAVFHRTRWFPISLFRPPYGGWVQRLALWAYLGRSR
jgi:coniferyl-aldehyde dehydrogenase